MTRSSRAPPVPRYGGAWLRARDAGGSLTDAWHLGYTFEERPGFTALFADGTAQFIHGRNGKAVLRALITRNGGEPVDAAKLE